MPGLGRVLEKAPRTYQRIAAGTTAAAKSRFADMSYRVDGEAGREDRTIDDITWAACRVASHPDIRAVYVVSSQRLSDDELQRLHECAPQWGVEFTIGASEVSFSRAPNPIETGDDGAPKLQWLRAHAKTWRAALATLSEGTRRTCARQSSG